MRKGFIKLSRKITDWEWYKNPNTMRVFVHLLIIANWIDGEYQGIKIKRGSVATKYEELEKELNLTKQEVRTAIKHLKSSGDITVKRYKYFFVVNIKNYSRYQFNKDREIARLNKKYN